MSGYVYILKLSHGKYYIGSTRNYKDRLQKHTVGGVRSTASYLPFELQTIIQYDSYSDAYAIEKRLKKSKSRLIIEKYINNN